MSIFIDEATVDIRSGDGGPGAVSFRREKFIPRGGPDGGDGGRGGDVWVVAKPGLSSLLDLRYKRKYSAESGRGGSGSHKTGADGDSVEIFLPLGSLIYDSETQDLLFEVRDPQDRFLLAQGGRGGKGNAHFKSSTHQAPKFAQPGEQGVIKKLRIELKLLADVGLVGYPNAGKSTLISKISAARPKVAPYPFTTLVPQLGVVRVNQSPDSPHFVMADVPGLIEGASLGRGLGHKFLRHLERTQVLVHLVDGARLRKEFKDDLIAIAEGFKRDKEIIDAELYTFSSQLFEKPTLLYLNKSDLFSPEEKIELASHLSKIGFSEVKMISGASYEGLQELIECIYKNISVHGVDARKNKEEVLLPDQLMVWERS